MPRRELRESLLGPRERDLLGGHELDLDLSRVGEEDFVVRERRVESRCPEAFQDGVGHPVVLGSPGDVGFGGQAEQEAPAGFGVGDPREPRLERALRLDPRDVEPRDPRVLAARAAESRPGAGGRERGDGEPGTAPHARTL